MKKITDSMFYIQKGSLIMIKNRRTLYYCSSTNMIREIGSSSKAELLPKDGTAYLFVDEGNQPHRCLKTYNLTRALVTLAHEDILKKENACEVPF